MNPHRAAQSFLARVVRAVLLLNAMALCAPALCAQGMALFPSSTAAPLPDDDLTLVRAARPWEFVSALGTHAALLGNEGGNFEAWVYPLKIFRSFHLRFKADGQVIDGQAIARSVTVRPESTTITYAWDTFSVQETLFVPIHEPGAIIHLEIDAAQPVQIEAIFERDFQLEWPGAMGGSDIDWNPILHAFSFTETQQKFSALVGSPSATDYTEEYVTNYTASKENGLFLGTVLAGRSTRSIIVAASFASLPPADVTYRKLAASYVELTAESRAYYQDYLRDHVSLQLPDHQLQMAYQWAQIGVLQGMVDNPFLGTGLVAGYRMSGEDQRPGYAWFFGRDALWTSFALNAEGDYATTRTVLEFLAKYQREDGKITHEIAQGASFVPWFQGMPFAYAAADATPLFIIAMDDYVRQSGDKTFAEAQWSGLVKAHTFIQSTYDKSGLPRNDGIGHGWVEGGPLLPVESELYQTSVVIESLKSLVDLARILNKTDVLAQTWSELKQKQPLIDKEFWLPEVHRYAFAIDSKGQPADTLSVLATVPMWFGLLDKTNTSRMLPQLSAPDLQTDWGMRIIPSTSSKYQAAGYHAGTVWPLFTGWASVGEYRYHASFAAYQNLHANALLTFDGSLGHVAEVLSGNYYQTLATASPNQIWSSAMVISPLLKGLLGLETEATSNKIILNTHIPADWSTLSITNVQAGTCRLNFDYAKTLDKLILQVERTAGDHCLVEFSPSFSPQADISRVELNGKSLPFQLHENSFDQHPEVRFEVSKDNETVTIHFKNDFGLVPGAELPPLGSVSNGLRLVSESWSEDRQCVVFDFASAQGGSYSLKVVDPSTITKIEGAKLTVDSFKQSHLRIEVPPAALASEAHQQVKIHFGAVPVNRHVVDDETNLKGASCVQ